MVRQKSNAEVYFETHQRYKRALELIKTLSADSSDDARLAQIHREAKRALVLLQIDEED
jgi:hypothetical protein